MKIAVVDDFQKDRDYLAIVLESYMKEQGIDGSVYGYPGGEEFLEAFNKSGRFDIVFLDIYMNGMDGMSVAKQLRQKDAECCLVFVTSSDSFAVEGYKVRAFRYLVKPYEKKELDDILDELFSGEKKERPYLEIREDRVSKKIYRDEIVMAELDGHYTIIHLKNGESARIRMTVRELADELKEPCFLECYRNLLVNLDYVEQVEDGRTGWEFFIMKGAGKAPIQKTRRMQVRQYFADYLFQKAQRGEGSHGR